MATTKTPKNNPDYVENPGQGEFDKIVEQEFSPGDKARMEDQAQEGAEEDAATEATEADDDERITRKDLADAEATALETEIILYADQVGRGYINKPRNLGFIRRQLGKRNRIFLIGGPVVGVVVIALVIFFSLLPFKILHIVNNLQSHFFASSESAVQGESNVLFSDYIRKYVLPAARGCRVNIDKSCNPISNGSLVSQLYKGWKNAKLEDKIATKYGVEFRYSQKSNHYYLKTRDLNGNGFDLGTPDSGFESSDLSLDDYITQANHGLDSYLAKVNDPQFQRVTRSQLRAVINDSIDRETGMKKIMYRFKVGRLAEKKYGLKRCIIACDTRDNFADWKDNKTRAAKMILAERVLAPRSETLALVIQCVLDDSCDPSRNTETDSDGRKQSRIQRDVQAKLAELAAQDTGKYATVLIHSNGILQDGYQKYLAKQVAKKLVVALGGKDASTVTTEKIAGNLVPVVGWVNSASSTIGTLQGDKTKIKALAYLTNAKAMVSTYGAYRTFADESKSGHVDPAIMGSFNDSLGLGDSNSAGGIATAEQSPLYGYLIGGDINSAGSAISSFLGGQAYAAGTTPAYKCNDGNPVPLGKLICPEEVLGGADSAIVSLIDSILKGLGPITALADYWNHSIGAVAKAIIGQINTITSPIVQKLSEFTHLSDLISSVSGPLVKAFTDYLIPNPFSDNMSGGRNFELAAGGADQLGSDFSQNGLGGRKLTSQQSAAILAEQNQQDLLQYKNQSLLARVFDTNSNYSVATKLAMAMPDSAKMASANLTEALFSNPFAKLANIFSPISSLGHAQAVGALPDPFGISQYGFPSNDPTLSASNQDPETYWANNCTTDGTTIDWSKPVNKDWQDNATVDPDTGLPENDTTDPCLLIQAAVGSSGALYDANLLTPDDLGN